MPILIGIAYIQQRVAEIGHQEHEEAQHTRQQTEPERVHKALAATVGEEGNPGQQGDGIGERQHRNDDADDDAQHQRHADNPPPRPHAQAVRLLQRAHQRDIVLKQIDRLRQGKGDQQYEQDNHQQEDSHNPESLVQPRRRQQRHQGTESHHHDDAKQHQHHDEHQASLQQFQEHGLELHPREAAQPLITLLIDAHQTVDRRRHHHSQQQRRQDEGHIPEQEPRQIVERRLPAPLHTHHRVQIAARHKRQQQSQRHQHAGHPFQ